MIDERESSLLSTLARSLIRSPDRFQKLIAEYVSEDSKEFHIALAATQSIYQQVKDSTEPLAALKSLTFRSEAEQEAARSLYWAYELKAAAIARRKLNAELARCETCGSKS